MEYYRAKLDRLNEQVEREKTTPKKLQGSGFVTFNSMVAASQAMQCQVSDKVEERLLRAQLPVSARTSATHLGRSQNILSSRASPRRIYGCFHSRADHMRQSSYGVSAYAFS